MALIECPECRQRVSDKAVACPSCGLPLEARHLLVSVIPPDHANESQLPEQHANAAKPPAVSAGVLIFVIIGAVIAVGFFLIPGGSFSTKPSSTTDSVKPSLFEDHYKVQMPNDAVMTSVKHLRTVWPGGSWPPDGLTFEQDLIDLGWHQKEFQRRTSFAYTVVTPSESKVTGCVYINPTRKRGYDAEVYLWARQSELESGLESRLLSTVQDWLAKEWPFKKVAFPGRDIGWEAWSKIPDEKR